MIANRKVLSVASRFARAETSSREQLCQPLSATELEMASGGKKRLRVALLGSYVPRKCGIATFTQDVFKSLAKLDSIANVDVYAIGDGGDYDYPSEVCCAIEKTEASYRHAATTLLEGGYDVLFVQHEFGLFGGCAGEMLFELLDRTTVPVVTMLHTLLQEPSDDQYRVLKRLGEKSRSLVTMSERGKRLLTSVYGVSESKIDVVPHGIPATVPRNLDENKSKFGLDGKLVALTFGLIGPGKGLEFAIQAMPEIVRAHPDFTYVLLGATHPNLLREQGEQYRDGLRLQAEKLGVSENFRVENRFVGITELTGWIGAADVYLTPYLNVAQITSGTLSYAYGCGTPVVSTPYWHAADLLSDGRGCLVPFRDSNAIAREVNLLLDDEPRRLKIANAAYEHGRTMIWPAVAKQIAKLLQSPPASPLVARSAAESDAKFLSLAKPPFAKRNGSIDLRHLVRLTDDTGIVQHAICALPNRHEGYCVDDNARALLLTLLLENSESRSVEIDAAQSRYVEFVNHAIEESTGLVRNFMSYSREWLESVGADDSVGRTSWVLGACMGRTTQHGIRLWANRMYLPILRKVAAMGSLRAWCFGLLGICEYRSHDKTNIEINELGRDLMTRIAYRRSESVMEDWPWFEDRLTYDNAKLPHALFAAACSFDIPQWKASALESLEWLCKVQTDSKGLFLPIGSESFYVRGETRSLFDQQPLEAWATVSACLSAFEATGDGKWLVEAEKAHGWFLGKNISGLALVDESTGGCFDGLHCDRVNCNQGAESTLAWLLADTEMRIARRHQGSRMHAIEGDQ